MQGSVTDTNPMNDAQQETELNALQERRAAKMNEVANVDARLTAMSEEMAKMTALPARSALPTCERWPRWTLPHGGNQGASCVPAATSQVPRALPPLTPSPQWYTMAAGRRRSRGIAMCPRSAEGRRTTWAPMLIINDNVCESVCEIKKCNHFAHNKRNEPPCTHSACSGNSRSDRGGETLGQLA